MPVFNVHTENEKLPVGKPLSGIVYIDCIIHYIPKKINNNEEPVLVTTALFERNINVGDNKPLVKFPPMNKRRLLQLLPGIIANSDRQAQADDRINLRDEQM